MIPQTLEERQAWAKAVNRRHEAMTEQERSMIYGRCPFHPSVPRTVRAGVELDGNIWMRGLCPACESEE